jgi:hypothetical protein
MHTSSVTVATSPQPEPENFLGYGNSSRQGTPKEFDGLLSGAGFAVLVVICLALGALALLA